MLYPLSYEGGGCRKHGRKPGALLGLGGCLVILGGSRVSDALLVGPDQSTMRVRTR